MRQLLLNAKQLIEKYNQLSHNGSSLEAFASYCTVWHWLDVETSRVIKVIVLNNDIFQTIFLKLLEENLKQGFILNIGIESYTIFVLKWYDKVLSEWTETVGIDMNEKQLVWSGLTLSTATDQCGLIWSVCTSPTDFIILGSVQAPLYHTGGTITFCWFLKLKFGEDFF